MPWPAVHSFLQCRCLCAPGHRPLPPNPETGLTLGCHLVPGGGVSLVPAQLRVCRRGEGGLLPPSDPGEGQVAGAGPEEVAGAGPVPGLHPADTGVCLPAGDTSLPPPHLPALQPGSELLVRLLEGDLGTDRVYTVRRRGEVRSIAGPGAGGWRQGGRDGALYPTHMGGRLQQE